MKILFVVCILLLQNPNSIFEKNKGKLEPGIKHGSRIEYPKNFDPAIKPKILAYTSRIPDTVRAIFDGTVSEIVKTPNHRSYSLAIVYGDYSIVYGNLSKPEINVGDVIKRGQFIGTLAPMAFSPYYHMIQIYKGEVELDASEWIKK